MDRSTLEKLILSKLPLPEDCRQAIKRFLPLNPPTPTAALISQLEFDRQADRYEGGPALNVGGPGVRIPGDDYGRLACINGYSYLPFKPGEFGGWLLSFCYDPETGEPILGKTSTPTPWLESSWEDEVVEPWYLDEEFMDEILSRPM